MRLIEFITDRFTDASSSDMPPERNVMPGTAEGTVRSSVWIVALAMSCARTDDGSICLCVFVR